MRATSTRIEHSYVVRRKGDGALIAEARTTLACVDGEGKLRTMPEALLARLGAA